jgi:hypothetical protein
MMIIIIINDEVTVSVVSKLTKDGLNHYGLGENDRFSPVVVHSIALYYYYGEMIDYFFKIRNSRSRSRVSRVRSMLLS